eukprot:5246049-Pyramimonas_sp.AAC.1
MPKRLRSAPAAPQEAPRKPKRPHEAPKRTQLRPQENPNRPSRGSQNYFQEALRRPLINFNELPRGL